MRYTWRPAAAGPFVAAAVATLLLIASLVWGGDDDAGFLNGRQLRLMAPAAPGGGWDQTAREMQAALRGEVGRTEVYNVAGAGGTIGLSQFVRHDGDATQLMVMGLVMVGAIKSNDSPVALDQTTPLARLLTDYEVIVVPADSPVKGMSDLVAAMKDDVGKVSWAGGSAGGIEQILAGLVADAVGADPAEVNYVAHSGGGEALSTLLSGRATAGVSGVSELVGQIKAGTIRPIAVSSPQRLPNLPDVPTLKEQGVDVELANWRGVVAPPGISADDERQLEDLLVRMTRTDAWRETLERRGWSDATLTGDQFEQYLAGERRTVTDVLVKMGLA
ncbi:tripartite tricarboxylate transporter substrate-binding protein [Actinoplanes sp. TRM 88003]|uniref:Tripartite tricarboxylate transporter substrate-binding protein n=1 Tax=Paractinoplanes aksuensis TaxID=2939490 RepID=A0ABT1DI33_9ACTN|nr:tripartite tricarboxylate transporter substrate-binding protein [Actinoplanes aksuensis]MCO8270488.1 tripartite tricarboxylate transporter substrate-binding protein [Actinoplanes aksuensis]